MKHFTDDDLKHLKDDIVPYFPHKLEALLARLEAAEKVCELCIDGAPEVLKAKRAWRRAAGK
jgi:hypothetical protein